MYTHTYIYIYIYIYGEISSRNNEIHTRAEMIAIVMNAYTRAISSGKHVHRCREQALDPYVRHMYVHVGHVFRITSMYVRTKEESDTYVTYTHFPMCLALREICVKVCVCMYRGRAPGARIQHAYVHVC